MELMTRQPMKCLEIATNKFDLVYAVVVIQFIISVRHRILEWLMLDLHSFSLTPSHNRASMKPDFLGQKQGRSPGKRGAENKQVTDTTCKAIIQVTRVLSSQHLDMDAKEVMQELPYVTY